MPSFPPLLRSPPFPRVDPAEAAVSVRATGPEPDLSPERIETLLAAIREARIGGPSWAAPAEFGAVTAVLRPASASEAERMVEALPATDAAAPLILLPYAKWARHAAWKLSAKGIRTAIGEVDPWPLLTSGAAWHVHGDDEMAALACIAGAPLRIHTPGRFSSNATPPEERARLVARDLLAATRYRNPFTGEPCAVEEAIALLALWRETIDANHRIAVAAGIAWWKRREIERFLWAPRKTPLRFTTSTRPAIEAAKAAGAGIAVWPSRLPEGFREEAAREGVPLIRVEDGFVRSVGLGSNLFPPFSVAVDRRGIHYDPSRASDLEHLLETADFPEPLIERARALEAFIVKAGISKYGGAAAHRFPERAPARRLVLVPGQVEDDMSVLLGGGGLASNLTLLERVRALEPDAEIWFRPHPDVDAGHRRGAVPDEEALRHADKVVRGGGMAQLLDLVDGVHVLTSLTGFEALLRGRDVTTHGTPFYAGWGVTRDLGAVPGRRTRRLTVHELVAGVLILYPRYLDPVTFLPCPAELLVSRLAEQVRPKATWLTTLRRLQGRLASR
ncbi:capsular polysaccharide export protein, LipB/KpsS family [Sphingomonas sp. PR090111-T3T-6A]|uniref:capsular polysaccharide export protein, LipB/KpsS family n=1 Tax=Sphingomonas sp. PR090111-T3T-6A TaxID=685778 RepID=UPI00036F4FF2|nr:beta-3-deoxy-D-manno-oct-2-ulosonic acid transferase [Sphingomonas sp. PR090111-T3T-6A]